MAVSTIYDSYVPRVSEMYGNGLVRSTSFGRKRIALSNNDMDFGEDDGCTASTPSKRFCSLADTFSSDKKVALQDLPQEILVHILCSVEHDDLKRLFFVSKAIREATLIAKQVHFAYSTPRKTIAFRNVDSIGDFDDIETPNAPKRSKLQRNGLGRKKLVGIALTLFSAGDSQV